MIPPLSSAGTFWYAISRARALGAASGGSTGGQLAIFSQAFTRLSQINAAITLNSELDRRANRLEPAFAASG
jgi:hypothetical protein